MDEVEQDQFRRMELTAQTERARELIEQYFDGIRFYSGQMAELNHEMGKIDQRLGG